MRRSIAILVSIAVILILQILSLVWGIVYDWPDFYHVNYGFPFAWATHTLNTIAGPVDIWKVDISKLVIDVLFWDGILLILVLLFMLKLKD